MKQPRIILIAAFLLFNFTSNAQSLELISGFGISGLSNTELLIGTGDTVYVLAKNSSTGNLFVRKYDGTSWTDPQDDDSLIYLPGRMNYAILKNSNQILAINAYLDSIHSHILVNGNWEEFAPPFYAPNPNRIYISDDYSDDEIRVVSAGYTKIYIHQFNTMSGEFELIHEEDDLGVEFYFPHAFIHNTTFDLDIFVAKVSGASNFKIVGFNGVDIENIEVYTDVEAIDLDLSSDSSLMLIHVLRDDEERSNVYSYNFSLENSTTLLSSVPDSSYNTTIAVHPETNQPIITKQKFGDLAYLNRHDLYYYNGFDWDTIAWTLNYRAEKIRYSSEGELFMLCDMDGPAGYEVLKLSPFYLSQENDSQTVFNYELTSNNEMIEIKTAESYDLGIYDLSGRLVYQSSKKKQHLVNKNSFDSGMYIFRFSDEFNDYSLKVVIE